MTTTRKVRAGPIDCASSGCNGPRESECMGLCTQKVNADQISEDGPSIWLGLEQEDPIQFAGDEPMPLAARIAIIVLLAVIVGALIVPLPF
jgi:hypothetical protein